MKFFVYSIAILCGSFLNAQEKTYTGSELDSISKKDDMYDSELLTKDKDSTSFKIIERIPIYKGCENEKGNPKKKDCMNEKISEFFKTHYNTTLPEDSKVPSGKTRIFVEFVVDEQGNVVEGTATGADEYLENEALRVLKLLPRFSTPGYIRNTPVKIPFSLPLMVNVVRENYTVTNATYPVFRGCDRNLSFEDTKKCTTEKIIDYIKVSFDYILADKVFPTEETTKFFVEFQINEKGKTEHINVKAHHKAVAIDVINLIKRMPKFKPAGTLNGKPSSTPFSATMTVHF